MDTEIFVMLLKIIVVLPFIIFLIYISFKYGGTKLQNMQNGKFIKILERVALSKDNSIMIIKIGEKDYIVTSANNRIEILRELEVNETIGLEKSRVAPQYGSLSDIYSKLKRKGR